MRIIGGEFGGRKFYPPADNWPTRPTTDFAKEALFNILVNRFDLTSVRFLDLFGGTGNHSIEMLSRGCQDVVYVDKFGGCVKFVKELVDQLGVAGRIRINKADVFRFCMQDGLGDFDYIFAGPPYKLPNIPELPDLIFNNALLKQSGLFVLETNHLMSFEDHPNFSELRKYGQCHFSFFTHTGKQA